MFLLAVATPSGIAFGATPVASLALRIPATPKDIKSARVQAEFDQRNRPLTDAEIDAVLPPTGALSSRGVYSPLAEFVCIYVVLFLGYEIIPPPASYLPIRTPSRKVTETPTPLSGIYCWCMLVIIRR